MKKTAIKIGIALVFIFGAFDVNAQNEFEAWKKQQINDFSDYKSKQDKEFASFLKAHWVEIKGQKSKPLYDRNKIIKPPVAPTLVKKEPPKKVVIVKLPEKKPEEKKPGVPVVVPKLLPIRGESIKLLFFGNELVFPYDKKMIKRMHTKIDKDAISSHWSL
ncbi:MAG: hypothetical protein OEX19_15380, partial [Gammaproteobacteria bacterium]|nr:hypothetical protein [Gammaproteobacteria bacterium]